MERYTPELKSEYIESNIIDLDQEDASEDDWSRPPAIQSGRAKHHGKGTRGNHRSGLRGKGRDAFSRNKWMKNVI